MGILEPHDKSPASGPRQEPPDGPTSQFMEQDEEHAVPVPPQEPSPRLTPFKLEANVQPDWFVYGQAGRKLSGDMPRSWRSLSRLNRLQVHGNKSRGSRYRKYCKGRSLCKVPRSWR